MKKIIFFTLVLSLFAFSAQGAELKIGYVDLYKALNESTYGIKAKEVLENMVKDRQTAIDEKGMEIQKLKTEMEQQASVITPEAKKEKENQINKLLGDYQQMIRNSEEELRKKERELTQEILKDLRDIVNKIGETEGYTIIFEAGKNGIILYSQKKLDLTDIAIKKYNEIKK